MKGDNQLQEYIDENEKIIEKYHRKINEFFQLMKDSTDSKGEVHWSPVALDYKRMEEEEKKSCEQKQKILSQDLINNEQVLSDDKGVYL